MPREGFKALSLNDELVEELESLGERAAMGFKSTADAVHWAMRVGVERLRTFIINRQKLETLNNGLKPEVAE